jgi:ATP-dependent RNA helicase HelY
VPVVSLAQVRIPKSFNGRNPQMRRDLASSLRNKTHGLTPPPTGKRRPERTTVAESAQDREVAELRAALKAHPCHACPDREDHDRWAQRHFKLERESETLRRRVENRTNTVARQFDRVCEVLSALGYLGTSAEGAVEVTDRGRTLQRLYSELDLLAAESLRAGLWDGLTVPELAAALWVLVYETRRADDSGPPRLPSARVREVVGAMTGLWASLDALERDHKLDFLRQPDAGFAWAAYRWAEGDELDDVLKVVELAAGDFVRWAKQLLDLAGQVADAAGPGELRETARGVVRAVRRGVVAYTGLGEEE